MVTLLIISLTIYVIVGIYSDFYLRKKIKEFLLRNGSKPIDYWIPSNFSIGDSIRFYKVYRNKTTKEKEDRILFLQETISFSIGYLILLIWIIILIFFPEFVFGE